MTLAGRRESRQTTGQPTSYDVSNYIAQIAQQQRSKIAKIRPLLPSDTIDGEKTFTFIYVFIHLYC